MKEVELTGFDIPENFDDDPNENAKLSKKISKKSGGFQGMALSFPVLKGILKRGYKIPTPIQRKTIPLALEGRDVVAMARTGSGKTACFLIPLLEKLKTGRAEKGARALILSPTRELALQTLKFTKELGKFTGLKAAVILGGDSMDDQFGIVHGNPDIIVATPGRFLHICVEMDLNLNSVEYVVFDEADRLFEMGWGEQIQEIANRLPESRQTLLFSATLPKVLVEFSKAGLSDPVLVRLDVESQLPDELTLSFVACRPEEKLAVLLLLLKQIMKSDARTVVFAATMHHVEYVRAVLDEANISNTFIYSNLDPSARKINAAKFQSGKARVLVVTDVAARGIDIPHLDYVINYNFPAKSKLFVHRVGRCARAGRTGTAYSIVSPDEYAHLLDLHLFLGLPLTITSHSGTPETGAKGSIGKLPQSAVEDQLAELIRWHDTNTDLRNMQQVSSNAYQQYIRSRPIASTESVKRVKELRICDAGILPEYRDTEPTAADLLARIKMYRPQGTIFEIGAKPSSVDYKVMKATRASHKNSIEKFKQWTAERDERANNDVDDREKARESTLVTSTADDITAAFARVVTPKKRRIDDLYRASSEKRRKRNTKDEEFYIPYAAPDKHKEDGLAVNNFTSDAERVQMDLSADNEDARRLGVQIKKWDRKKKKMVTLNSNSKIGKIRTESGAWIPATYKTNRYAQWKEKTKITDTNDHDDEDDNEREAHTEKLRTSGNTHWARHNRKLKEKVRSKAELKRPEQVLKARKLMEKKRERSGRKGRKSGKGRKKGGGGGGGGGRQRSSR